FRRPRDGTRPSSAASLRGSVCKIYCRGPERKGPADIPARRDAMPTLDTGPTMGLNYERIMAYRPADIAVNYGERDCTIYALGIGLGMNPLDPGELKFVYERGGLAAFPTMAVVLGWPGRMTDPAFGVDDKLVVAGDLKVV